MDPVVEVRTGTSRWARLVVGVMRLTVRPWMSYWPLTPRWIRPLAVIDWMAPLVLPAPRWASVESVGFGAFGGEWVRSPRPDGERVVLYLHGGGFYFCGLRTHRRMVARIAAASCSTVLSVGFRQQPAVPLDVSVADCVRSYRWLLEQGYAPERIIVAGDSTGGYLAFATVLQVIAEGLPGPAAIVAMAPMTNLDDSAKTSHENARLCACFSVRTIERNAAMRCGQGISPVDAELKGLPPVLIQVGSTEMLLPDAELMARRLADAGVPCELTVWPGQPHVFQLLADLIPEGQEAIQELGAFIRRHSGH